VEEIPYEPEDLQNANVERQRPAKQAFGNLAPGQRLAPDASPQLNYGTEHHGNLIEDR
jgi:hypothetical protein